MTNEFFFSFFLVQGKYHQFFHNQFILVRITRTIWHHAHTERSSQIIFGMEGNRENPKETYTDTRKACEYDTAMQPSEALESCPGNLVTPMVDVLMLREMVSIDQICNPNGKMDEQAWAHCCGKQSARHRKKKPEENVPSCIETGRACCWAGSTGNGLNSKTYYWYLRTYPAFLSPSSSPGYSCWALGLSQPS